MCKMLQHGRLTIMFQICFITLIVIQSSLSITEKRRPKHLFPLLGYLHGYKIGQLYAFQLPPYLLSPIVVVPNVNQQQSVSIQKAKADKNSQEHSGVFQNISPAQLILSSMEEGTKSKFQNVTNLTQSIQKSTEKLSDEFRLLNENSSNDTNVIDLTQIDSTTTANTETEYQSSEVNLAVSNLYDNTSNINNMIETTESQPSFVVPDFEDKWQSFSSNPLHYNSTDNNNDNSSENNNSNINLNNFTPYNNANVYPTPQYKVMADKISITTNSYNLEDSQASYNDKLDRYVYLSKEYSSSGFKPLAGLYYDGFLRKSEKKANYFYRNSNNLL